MPPTPTAPPGSDYVLLSTASWSHALWTNKQHVACTLAKLGKRVAYVYVPTRPPRLTPGDVARIWSYVALPRTTSSNTPENVWPLRVPVLPWHSSRPIRAINRLAFGSALQKATNRLGFRKPTLLTYSPLTSELLDLSAFAKVVYHCVDDIASQPDMPAKLIRDAETALIRRADHVYCTNVVLHERAQKLNPNSKYLPNVADFEHFKSAMSASAPADLEKISGPRIIFIGAISRYKVNFDLVSEVARLRPQYSFVFIGPLNEGEKSTDVTTLLGVPNIHLLGGKSYNELPSYLGASQVAILPSNLNDYTSCMFPMKFFEYMGAGLPIVATPLESLKEYAEYCFLAGTAQEFAAALDKAILGEGASREERLSLASKHTYERRTSEMLADIEAP